MLTQVAAGGAGLVKTSKALEWVESKATSSTRAVEALAKQIQELEHRTAALGKVEARVQALVETTEQGQQRAEKLIAPDGELEKHRLQVQELSSQVQDTSRKVGEDSAAATEAVKELELKVNEGLKQAARGKDTLVRINQVAQETQAKLDAATQLRDEFARETARMEKDGHALVDVMRAHVERLAVEKKEFGAFDERVGAMHRSVQDAEQRMEGLTARERQLERIQDGADRLAQDNAQLRDTSREAREDSVAATEAVKEVGRQLQRLTQLQELDKATDEKIRSLNALIEHVDQKVLALDAQKQVIDRAVGETNRLNETARNMEARIGKVSASVQEAEQRMKAIGVKEQQLAYLPQRFEEFSKYFQALLDQADELAKKQATLEQEQHRRDRGRW